MRKQFFILGVLTSLFLEAIPPQKIPSDLVDSFTLGGQIPVLYWYINEEQPPGKSTFFDKDQIDQLILDATARKTKGYGVTDLELYHALNKHKKNLKGKKAVIIGSQSPWYEAIALSYGMTVYTIEYNDITTNDPRINYLSVEEGFAKKDFFDVVISISSIEHDGLGRYGDPVNPTGDLEAMQKIKHILKKDGLVFLAVPIGPDALVWNAHRIYGPIRLKMLCQGFHRLSSHGLQESLFSLPVGQYTQPVLVLTH